MRTKFFSVATVALLAIVLSTLLIFGGPSARANNGPDIDTTIADGLAWLAGQQQGDGHFESPTGSSGQHAAVTCLALVKFQERGWELYPSPGGGPFDAAYPYKQTVEDALDYVFGEMVSDTDGVHFGGGSDVYRTSICMMAVAASREPSKVVSVAGSDVDTWTYAAVLQGMLDWMEYAQNDGTYPCDEGGWGYWANQVGWSDNSNTGYATLAIGYATSPAYGFGLTVDSNVVNKLKTFVDNIQDYPGTGASKYESCGAVPGWYNILKTGNLLYEMKFVGRAETDATVEAAIDYIETNWTTACIGYVSASVGWQGYYQAMFTMMKGLEAYGIDTLDAPIGDWFDDVSTYIKNSQNDDDSWGPAVCGPVTGDLVLQTTWALLTLERVVAIPPEPPEPVVSEYDLYVRASLQCDTESETITLTGTIETEDHIFSVKNEDGDEFEEIPTEITAMSLTGSSSLLGDGTVTLPDPAHDCYQRSKGEVEERANNTPNTLDVRPITDTGSGDAFFDVYFQIEGNSIAAHNHEPLHIEALIHNLLGSALYQSEPGVSVELFDNETDKSIDCYISNMTANATPTGQAVGGIVEIQVDGSDSPASLADGSGSSSPPYAALAGAAAAGTLAIVAGAWYARRRWVR